MAASQLLTRNLSTASAAGCAFCTARHTMSSARSSEPPDTWADWECILMVPATELRTPWRVDCSSALHVEPARKSVRLRLTPKRESLKREAMQANKKRECHQ